MDINQLARMLRMQPSVDSAGQSIDMKRPIVFDKGGYDPHTELSMTATGKELGLPQANAFYNVPSIHNGQINNPDTFAGMNEIRKNVMKNPNAYKAYKNPQEAVTDAIQRSKDIGNMRDDELRRAVIMKYMEDLK
jgi:hypothetical protein